ncbi:type VII secretion system-associated protein [Streptomyces sp. NPDC001928]|uniref:type VII secretion system-associated protein n=1 Tax=Streptomyces sp. NPDC001928 TaxID=3154404 RepID=UPI00332D3473
MADDGSKVVLDKEWMKKFIDGEVADFQKLLERIGKDSEGKGGVMIQSVLNLTVVRPPGFAAEETWPLKMGAMEKGIGQPLKSQIDAAAEALEFFISSQQKLFDDIEDNMRETLRTLLDTEGASLNKIEGAQLLDVFEDVNDSIAESLEGPAETEEE